MGGRRRAVVTGSSGLVGATLVEHLDARGWATFGIDNNMRRDFFGPAGDTSRVLDSLRSRAKRFVHHDLDIRSENAVSTVVAETRPNLIVHCAAQPSHELARARPFDDFDINARGTLNLLEAARASCPESPFVFLSTNRVYGDAPNEIALVELPTRFDFADPAWRNGIGEDLRIDASNHGLFGASKAAADLLVQEYGRSFGLPTVCFRCSCLTGPSQAGVELHGFLSYLARAIREAIPYRILGYKGKQVRDNLHASDVCAAIDEFERAPRAAAVYNLGGGRSNSVSILEAIEKLEELTGLQLSYDYVDEPRRADHICYISDTDHFRGDYPGWKPEASLEEILRELCLP